MITAITIALAVVVALAYVVAAIRSPNDWSL